MVPRRLVSEVLIYSLGLSHTHTHTKSARGWREEGGDALVLFKVSGGGRPRRLTRCRASREGRHGKTQPWQKFSVRKGK